MKYGFVLLILFTALSMGQAQNIGVTQFQFATSVENRTPVAVDTTFAPSVGTVYCFTQIRGAADTTQISHVWYYKDQEKARIPLDVSSDDWRTWSSKKILNSWTGRWRVMIEDAEGRVLASTTFTIRR
mgnify:CR=1 FL=1